MTGKEFSSVAPGWRAQRSVAIPCFEWIGFARAPAALGAHAERPGHVSRLSGSGRSLHYAPDRWLISAPEPSTVAELERASSAGEGVHTEVSGKWLVIRIEGAAHGAPGVSPLAAGFAEEHVLKDRDCAALWVFDCPVIAARVEANIEIWLEASYEASFQATLESLGVTRP